MIKPKRGYARSVHLAQPKKVPDKHCENPACGAKLPRDKARRGYKYCCRDCRWDHDRVLAVERRPKDLRCAYCDKEIDIMREKPSYWAEHTTNFCDEICHDGYRRRTGQYEEMSKRGNAAMREYEIECGFIINYEDRAKAVSKNNREKPTKAKYFTRQGKVWGYDVKFYPHEDGDKYRVSVPELDAELGPMTAKTVKEGLKMVRERIVELRIEESKGS